MDIRSHRGILPLAFVMALLIELPLILYPVLANGTYQGINIAHFGTDQHFYLARGRDVLDGHGLGNSILREGKDAHDPFFTWNERVLLAPYRWLGVADQINVATLYTVMNAVGVFILVLLIYAFVYQLSNNRLLSATIAMFVIGGSSFVFYRAFFYEDMNLYGRASTPYLSSIGLFVYLNLLTRSLVRPRARTVIAATVAFGALFYIYLFTWSYALAFNGILFGLYALRRDWGKVKLLALVAAGGLLLGAANLFFLLRSLLLENDRAVRYFHYVQYTHAPLFSTVGAVLLVLFAVYWRKNRNDERLPVFLAFILAGWAALNQQVITGILIQPGHYYWYFVVPMGIILALFMIWTMMKRSWRPFFCIVLLLAVFANTVVGQYRSTLKSLPRKLDEQRFQPILRALQADPEPSVVLAAGNENAFLFTIFTRHDLFWHDGATYFHPTEERMKDALSVFLLLDRGARRDPTAFLQKAADGTPPSGFYTEEYFALEGFTYGLSYEDYLRDRNRREPALLRHRQALMEELSNRMKGLVSDPTRLKDLLALYGVEYVVWDETKYPDWDVFVLPGIREMMSAGDLRLYRLEAS